MSNKIIYPLKIEASKGGEARKLSLPNRIEERLRQEYNFDIIIGQIPNMVNLLNLIIKIKDVDAPVLIEGESGVGKELIVRSIHDNGKRKNHPFMRCC